MLCPQKLISAKQTHRPQLAKLVIVLKAPSKHRKQQNEDDRNNYCHFTGTGIQYRPLMNNIIIISFARSLSSKSFGLNKDVCWIWLSTPLAIVPSKYSKYPKMQYNLTARCFSNYLAINTKPPRKQAKNLCNFGSCAI